MVVAWTELEAVRGNVSEEELLTIVGGSPEGENAALFAEVKVGVLRRGRGGSTFQFQSHVMVLSKIAILGETPEVLITQ